MTTLPERPDRPTSRPPSPWALLRWPVLAALLALGLAVSAHGASRPRPAAAGVAPAASPPGECRTRAFALPPGHPPISGSIGGGLRLALPPGHPPIDGRAAAVPGPLPVFDGPGTVDL